MCVVLLGRSRVRAAEVHRDHRQRRHCLQQVRIPERAARPGKETGAGGPFLEALPARALAICSLNRISGGWHSTKPLKTWSGRGDSNPRPQPWQGVG
jgi:hypothetical protein